MTKPNGAGGRLRGSRGKFFLLTYYQSPRDLNLSRKEGGRGTYKWQVGTRPMESQLLKVRDGLASGLLISFLHGEGYKYAGPILNLPDTVAAELKGTGVIKHSEVPAGGSD